MTITRRESLTLIAATAALGAANAESVAAYDVAVIGAGAFGAWTAERLKSAGASVVLIDQYGVAHARASSAGESRVTRISYGGDPLYSEMARESLLAWRELSARAATPLYYGAGVLWFSPADDQYMAKSLQYLKATQTAHMTFTADGMRRLYPQMRFAEGEAGFLEVESGALIAGRGVQTAVALAQVPVVLARCGPPRKIADAYEPAPGVRAKSLVYACGPWLAKIFPDLLGRRIVATRQEVLHFGPAPGDDRFGPRKLPVWADFNKGAIVYGIPDLEGQGFKLAFDAHGAEVDPDSEDRRVDRKTVENARDYLKTRFPDLADAPLVHSRVCQYENTSNGDFLIDRHPEFDDVWLVGGGSGHGFKHAPAVGRIVAGHLADPKKPVEPRFSLQSKETVRKRTVF